MCNLTKILINFIYIYQIFISPIIGNRCRFYPTCSNYGIKVLKNFGIKGLLLIIKRIIKCHPYNKGGVDHAPKK